MPASSFRDLIAWQRAMDLAEGVYRVSRSWSAEEVYGRTAQAQRAAVSVMANIAEGKGRTGVREYLHHLSIADGSLAEVEALLLFAQRLGLVDAAALGPLMALIEETRSLIRGLIRSLR